MEGNMSMMPMVEERDFSVPNESNPKLPPPTAYVKPRIEEIEQRIQSRATSSQNDRSNAALSSSSTSSSHSNSNNLSNHERFQFLSNLPGCTSNLKQFESEALRRQAEHSSRISDLECRLALFQARLALESAERDREHAATIENCINGPLEEAMRHSMERLETQFVRTFMDPARADDWQLSSEEDNSEKEEKKEFGRDSDIPNLVSIERRINLLEAKMNHHKHITLFHSQRRTFDAVSQKLRSELYPVLALETTKANKREGTLVRLFEASAGERVQLLAKVQTSRASSLGYIRHQIESWKAIDRSRADIYVTEIRALKEMIMRESEERKVQDELVVEKILKTREILQEDILALLGER